MPAGPALPQNGGMCPPRGRGILRVRPSCPTSGSSRDRTEAGRRPRCEGRRGVRRRRGGGRRRPAHRARRRGRRGDGGRPPAGVPSGAAGRPARLAALVAAPLALAVRVAVPDAPEADSGPYAEADRHEGGTRDHGRRHPALPAPRLPGRRLAPGPPRHPRRDVIANRVAGHPAAVWFADHTPATLTSRVRAVTSAAAAQGRVPVLVPYAYPTATAEATPRAARPTSTPTTPGSTGSPPGWAPAR